jgi:asparagine synthetase A
MSWICLFVQTPEAHKKAWKLLKVNTVYILEWPLEFLISYAQPFEENLHFRVQRVYLSLEALEIEVFREKFLLQNMHEKIMFLISAFAWVCKLQ